MREFLMMQSTGIEITQVRDLFYAEKSMKYVKNVRELQEGKGAVHERIEATDLLDAL